jgi:hypothetical protein
LMDRNLPRVIIGDQPTDANVFDTISEHIQNTYGVNKIDASYFLFQGEISNNAFSSNQDMIQILLNNNLTKDISEISDILNVPYLQKSEKKYFICFPKDCGV